MVIITVEFYYFTFRFEDESLRHQFIMYFMISIMNLPNRFLYAIYIYLCIPYQIRAIIQHCIYMQYEYNVLNKV